MRPWSSGRFAYQCLRSTHRRIRTSAQQGEDRGLRVGRFDDMAVAELDPVQRGRVGQPSPPVATALAGGGGARGVPQGDVQGLLPLLESGLGAGVGDGSARGLLDGPNPVLGAQLSTHRMLACEPCKREHSSLASGRQCHQPRSLRYREAPRSRIRKARGEERPVCLGRPSTPGQLNLQDRSCR